MKTTKLFTLLFMTSVFAILFGVSITHAELQLNRIYTDPAIIAAGDVVDVVIEYEAKDIPFESNRVGDDEYKFEVRLSGDDDVTNEYITILDSQGDGVKGQILQGITYNEVFRIKVNTNAPAAPYQFKLKGQWYKNGAPIGYAQEEKFELEVKKEGILLDVATLETLPSKIRPGDDAVEIAANIENSGFKDAKSVEANLESIPEIEASFSDDNRVWVGYVGNSEQKEVSFFVDIKDGIKSGVYNLTLQTTFMDLDNNQYSKDIIIPLRIHSKPELIIEEYRGSGKAGSEGTLEVVVRNIGEQSAEAVDVRIVKQSTQPFAFDVRSNYIGELQPNETGVAIFNFDVLSDATYKTHDLQLFLRAKGDSDEGDNTIYTYQRRAQFDVTGSAPNYFILTGVIVVIIVLGIFISRKIWWKRK